MLSWTSSKVAAISWISALRSGVRCADSAAPTVHAGGLHEADAVVRALELTFPFVAAKGAA